MCFPVRGIGVDVHSPAVSPYQQPSKFIYFFPASPSLSLCSVRLIMKTLVFSARDLVYSLYVGYWWSVGADSQRFRPGTHFRLPRTGARRQRHARFLFLVSSPYSVAGARHAFLAYRITYAGRWFLTLSSDSLSSFYLSSSALSILSPCSFRRGTSLCHRHTATLRALGSMREKARGTLQPNSCAFSLDLDAETVKMTGLLQLPLRNRW